MKLVPLTMTNLERSFRDTVYINPELVAAVVPRGQRTAVFYSGSDDPFYVEESAEQIVEMLKYQSPPATHYLGAGDC